jgi:uncharacterized protein (TIGR02145 family)
MPENLNYNASGSVCYGNSAANCDKYGRLYDWWSASYTNVNGYYYGDKAGWSDSEGSNRKFDKLSLFSIRCLKN